MPIGSVGRSRDTPLVEDGHIDQLAMHEIARTFYILNTAFRDQEIADGDAARFLIDGVVWLAENVLGEVPNTYVQVGVAGRPDRGRAARRAGPAPAGSRRRARGSRISTVRRAMAVATLVVISALVTQMTEAGTLPDGTLADLHVGSMEGPCVDLAVYDQIHRFVLGIEDEDARDVLRIALESMLSANYAADQCDRE